MYKYPKIETIYKRDTDGTKKLIPGDFRNETVEYLKDNRWYFTEKIDGMNIVVEWDGHAVYFFGRTEKAQIPNELLSRLEVLFGGETNAQLFEQTFGEETVVFYGEGYGRKIQNGGNYISDGVDFILFDIFLPEQNLWLRRESIEDIAKTFNIDCIPFVGFGTLEDGIRYIKLNPPSKIGSAMMEGIVCKPMQELFDRRGKRIIVKIKWEDFKCV